MRVYVLLEVRQLGVMGVDTHEKARAQKKHRVTRSRCTSRLEAAHQTAMSRQQTFRAKSWTEHK